MAGVDPATITYLEGHGTATPLGDPVEIAGLTQAFRTGTAARGFCALGSVKSNIGHLDAAAGVAGLIKTVLALQHRQIPPSLHFTEPNPKLDLAESPFFVNTRLREWTGDGPLRAGVSSFGVGGTNAHVVLEEAPAPVAAAGPGRPRHLLVISGRSQAALAATAARLADHLERYPESDLADVAYTLQVGRHAFAERRWLVAANREEAVRALRAPAAPGSFGTARSSAPPVVFVFPGQGSQYLSMGRSLYDEEPFFRRIVDECASVLESHLGCDLRGVLYPAGDPEAAAERMRQTRFTQSAIFVVEYALARLWQHWGVEPETMLGHSVGEFVAATLAGVFRLEDALHLVAVRGRMMQEQPTGAMLSVRRPAAEVREILPAALDLAAVNAPRLCVVSGPASEVDAFAERLGRDGIPASRLHTSHAFHSRMMDPVVEPFAAEVRRVQIEPPTRPLISTVTGRPLTTAEATDPLYWARHLRATVRFADAVREAWKVKERVLLEIGPRNTATTLAKQTADDPNAVTAVASLEATSDDGAEWKALLQAAGKLWVAGVPLAWPAVNGGPRRRVPLPTYPFERVRCWVDPPAPAQVRRIFQAAPPAAVPHPAPAPEPAHAAPDPLVTKGYPMTSDRHDPSDGRLDRATAAIRSIIEDATGIALQGVDPSTSFTEIGLDSLALTQCAQLIKRDLGVEVSFRQLIERLTSVAELARHVAPLVVDEKLPGATAPPEPSPEPAPLPQRAPAPPIAAAPVLPVSTAAPAAAWTGAGAYAPAAERVVSSQLDLMARQLELLGRAAAAALTGGLPLGVSAAAIPSGTLRQAASSAAGERAAEPAGAMRADPAAPAVAVAGPARPKKVFGPGARIETTAVALPAAEREALEAFMRRYTARTAGSKRFTAENRGRLADPRVVSGFKPFWKEIVYPIVVDRSEGSRLWDIDGNEYVDLTCGFGADFLGHRPPYVVEAVKAQLDRGFEIGPQHPLVAEVAQRLCALTGHDRVAFCNTGSEAVLGADAHRTDRDRARSHRDLRRGLPRHLRRGDRAPRPEPAFDPGRARCAGGVGAE